MPKSQPRYALILDYRNGIQRIIPNLGFRTIKRFLKFWITPIRLGRLRLTAGSPRKGTLSSFGIQLSRVDHYEIVPMSAMEYSIQTQTENASDPDQDTTCVYCGQVASTRNPIGIIEQEDVRMTVCRRCQLNLLSCRAASTPVEPATSEAESFGYPPGSTLA